MKHPTLLIFLLAVYSVASAATPAEIQIMESVESLLSTNAPKGALVAKENPFFARGLPVAKDDSTSLILALTKRIASGNIMRRGDSEFLILGEKKLKENEEAEIAVDGKTLKIKVLSLDSDKVTITFGDSKIDIPIKK